MKPRVRNDEAGFVDDEIAVENDVEIERPRLAWRGAHAAALRFERQQPLEKRSRGQLGVPDRGGVQEVVLIGNADRHGDNWMITGNGKVRLIDNDTSFATNAHYAGTVLDGTQPGFRGHEMLPHKEYA